MIIDNGRSRYHIGYSSLRWQETEDQRIRVLQMPIPGTGHEDIGDGEQENRVHGMPL